jgi:hypothetical protein
MVFSSCFMKIVALLLFIIFGSGIDCLAQNDNKPMPSLFVQISLKTVKENVL